MVNIKTWWAQKTRKTKKEKPVRVMTVEKPEGKGQAKSKKKGDCKC